MTQLFLLAVITWLSGELLIGALALPAVFGQIPDRILAGTVASTILRRWMYVKFACLAVAAGSTAWRGSRPRLGALAVMAALLLFQALYLSPKMESLRPLLATAAAESVRPEFARLHSISVGTGMAGVIAGLVAVFFS